MKIEILIIISQQILFYTKSEIYFSDETEIMEGKRPCVGFSEPNIESEESDSEEYYTEKEVEEAIHSTAAEMTEKTIMSSIKQGT